MRHSEFLRNHTPASRRSQSFPSRLPWLYNPVVPRRRSMPELDIATAETEKDLMAFITFPWAVYRGDPHWVPPLISERRSFLNPEINPFFEHSRAQYFLARRAGQVVGTIGAFTNGRYNEFQGVNVGFFGFFEVLDDPQAAAALLSRAEQWA